MSIRSLPLRDHPTNDALTSLGVVYDHLSAAGSDAAHADLRSIYRRNADAGSGMSVHGPKSDLAFGDPEGRPMTEAVWKPLDAAAVSVACQVCTCERPHRRSMLL